MGDTTTFRVPRRIAPDREALIACIVDVLCDDRVSTLFLRKLWEGLPSLAGLTEEPEDTTLRYVPPGRRRPWRKAE